MARKGVAKKSSRGSKPGTASNPNPNPQQQQRQRAQQPEKKAPNRQPLNVPNLNTNRQQQTSSPQAQKNISKKSKADKKETKKEKPEKPKKSKDSNLEEVKIKKIGVMSFALTLALIHVIIGFILGIITAFVSLIVSIPPLGIGISGILNFILGLPALIIEPLIFGIFGFIMGAIIALFYNLAAKISKGIELYA